MLIKNLEKIEGFVAGDKTFIQEILHPKNDKLDIPYSLARATVEIGNQSLEHTLQNIEIYIILEGEATMFIGDNSKKVMKNDVITVPKGARQYIRNDGNGILDFLCIVSPPWSEEEEDILE